MWDTHTHTHTHIHILIYPHSYTHIHTHTHVHTHTHTYTQIKFGGATVSQIVMIKVIHTLSAQRQLYVETSSSNSSHVIVNADDAAYLLSERKTVGVNCKSFCFGQYFFRKDSRSGGG